MSPSRTENGVSPPTPPIFPTDCATAGRFTPGKCPLRIANFPVPDNVFFHASLNAPRSCRSSSPVPPIFPRADGETSSTLATSRLRIPTLAVKRGGSVFRSTRDRKGGGLGKRGGLGG